VLRYRPASSPWSAWRRTLWGIATLATGATAGIAMVAVPGATAATASPAASSAAAAASVRPTPSGKVIVTLADQLRSLRPTIGNLPQRTSKALAEQQAVIDSLPGGPPKDITHFSLANAFAATITPAQAAALAKNPAVASVTADVRVTLTPPATTAPASTKRSSTPAPAGTLICPSASAGATESNPYAVCPSNPNDPLVEPEGLGSIHAISTPGSPGAQSIASGAGVKVAVIADGLDPNAPDFIRPDGSSVVVDYKDFSGEGTQTPTGGAEEMGDASTIAAQGLVSHDLSTFVNEAHPLPAGCNIRILGVAPGASIVALKVLGNTFESDTTSIIQAINYAVTVDHVDVINESIGADSYAGPASQDAIELFNDEAVAAGVTVVAASGDAGANGTIGVPAADPNIISAAATTDYRIYQQIGYTGTTLSNGRWVNDNIGAFSSGGVTPAGQTPTLAAPGDSGWAACSTSPVLTECMNLKNKPQPSDIEVFGGTSQSSPFIAGVAALVIQAYRDSHHGDSPTPALVRQLLTSTATNLGAPATEQGAGLVNARAAVEAARQVSQPAAGGSHLLLSTDQILDQAAPGTEQVNDVTLTNTGSDQITVFPKLEQLTTVGTPEVQTVTMSSNDTTDPTVIGAGGTVQPYKTMTFTVQPGIDRLALAATYPAAGTSGPPTFFSSPDIDIVAIAPDGSYISNDRPQGAVQSGNYGNLDVVDPQAGSWTVILAVKPGSGAGFGTLPFSNINVQVQATQQRWTETGLTTPDVVTIPAGMSKTVKTRIDIPASGGDTIDSLTFGRVGSGLPEVPVVLRTLIPTASGTGTFSGTITGGNGRGGNYAQSFSYSFAVAPGHRDLEVSTLLAKAEADNDVIEGVLVDPNGEVRSEDTNNTLQAELASGVLTSPGMEITTANPPAGIWQLIIVVLNSVNGADLSMPFSGTIGFDQVQLSGQLPQSAATVLPQGKPTSITLHYTNNGVQPLPIQVDARTTTQQAIPLTSFTGQDTVTVPGNLISIEEPPLFLVPPQTSSVTFQATSSQPLLVNAKGPSASVIVGGQDLVGDLQAAQQGGTTSTVTHTSPAGDYVTQGGWGVSAGQVGTFTGYGDCQPAPAGCPVFPSATAKVSAVATAPGFDTTVTSSTGDYYQPAGSLLFDLSAPVVNPGDTLPITLTITPNAPVGTVVRGTLNLVTAGNSVALFKLLGFAVSGDVMESIPYTYTVGASS
jgi:hypothetical protein